MFDTEHRLRYTTLVKTIAISETAYERLAAWKIGERDTFSKVIERIVPPKGTFEAALEAAQHLPELSEEQGVKLADFYQKNRQPIETAWK